MLPNSGITTTMIGNELGIGTHALTKLCESTNINVHAARKPTYDITKPSGLVLTDVGGGHYTAAYRRLVSGEAHRMGDFRGYNHNAVPATLTSVLLTPDFINKNGQTIDVAFWFNTGEIDMREYGFTHISFTPTEHGNVVTSLKLTIPLDNISLNSVISNQGGAATPYTPFQIYTSLPENTSTTLGVVVEYFNSNGIYAKLTLPNNVFKLDKAISHNPPPQKYPENVSYTYTGDILTYSYYMTSKPQLPIRTDGNIDNVIFISWNGKDDSILSKFRSRNIRFDSPRNSEIATYAYTSETPDQAASKVFTYTRTYWSGDWPGLLNPNVYNITVV